MKVIATTLAIAALWAADVQADEQKSNPASDYCNVAGGEYFPGHIDHCGFTYEGKEYRVSAWNLYHAIQEENKKWVMQHSVGVQH